MPADVLDVAAYILQRRGSMTTMKLQKLVYYAQAWHLAWTGRPLFTNRIEAWRNGPVAPELFQQHRGRYSISLLPSGDPSKVGRRERDRIDEVLRAYAPLEASQLSALTHAERPWIDAIRSQGVIGHEAMRAYYSQVEQEQRGTRVEEIDWSGW